MSLFFNPASGKMEARANAADETRTPAHWQAFLTQGWDGEPLNGGMADPYNLSPWVSRAIKTIAGPIAQVEMEFSENETEIEDATLKSFWQKPAKGLGKTGRLSRFDTIEATVGWLCLKGEFFWVLDDTWLAVRAKFRSPFVIARPDRMRPIMDDGELIGWQWTDGNGRRHELIPEQVVSSRFWNPLDECKAHAPMATAQQVAESDYASGRFWKSLAESNGDLGETVIAPNGISPEQEAQIVRAMRAKRAAAKRGKFIPRFFVGDLKTEEPKIQSPDAAAVTQRLENRHEVYIALGVPPSFADVTSSYSIGSASDRYKLIEETCMPMASKIAEAAEEISGRLTDARKIMVRFDFDEHSTMQEVRGERMEAGRKMHEHGIPWDVISDHLKLKLPKFPGSEKAWLPFNLQEVPGNPVLESVAEDPETEGEGLKAFEELEALLKTGCQVHRAADPAAPNPQWVKLMKTRAPYVKRIRGIVDRAFYQARAETLANIAAAEKADKAIRAGAFDFLFDLGNFLEILVKPVFKVVTDAYEAAGNELLKDELGLSDPFIVADPYGIAALSERENMIRDAAQDVWNATRDTLEEGIQGGESYAKLSERVRETFNGASKTKSMRIAVTETGIAMESGRHEAMIQSGAKWKVWITSGDERVRDTHFVTNGKIIPMDEPFVVGGFDLMYPCDPNGPAGEIINCRCIHGPSFGPKEEKPADIEGNNPDDGIPF